MIMATRNLFMNFLLGLFLFATTVVSQGPDCQFCLGLSEAVCLSTAGCFWSTARRTCGNSCEYTTEEECGFENENDLTGESNLGCWRVCRWLPGGLSACIIKWDFHFDVCMAVDASESITDPEWATIRLFFIEAFIAAITPPSCNVMNPDVSGFCPHAGLVQFDSIAQVIMPNLTAIKPWYTEQSYCFTHDTVLTHLQPGWENMVRNMRSSLQQRRDGSRLAGGNTWTVEAVQRCADLLLNTYRNEHKALSLFILMTDGSPNGPSRCEGDVCSICEENPGKTDQFIARRRTDPGCDPAVAGETFVETKQDVKMDESQTRRLFVYFKTEVVGAFKSFAKLDCLLERNTPRFFEPIRVRESLLQDPDDPAARAEIGEILKVLTDTVCDFSDAPTMSPTKEPSVSPTGFPSMPPTKQPSDLPSTTPTRHPSDTPTVGPSRAPTKAPSSSPTRMPSNTPSDNPSMSPSSGPTESPTDSPSHSPSRSPTKSPTNGPTESPTESPSSSPSDNPSLSPTVSPSQSPSPSPTSSPTDAPSQSPSRSPSTSPTRSPTASPSDSPSQPPSRSPSMRPSANPTKSPTENPTRSPTKRPTNRPTNRPTRRPTHRPTNRPTNRPTKRPPQRPTWRPTWRPTRRPTQIQWTTKKPTARPTWWWWRVSRRSGQKKSKSDRGDDKASAKHKKVGKAAKGGKKKKNKKSGKSDKSKAKKSSRRRHKKSKGKF